MYDDRAHGIQSGRYLESLGWISMDIYPEFKVARRYLDNNVAGYQFHTGISKLDEFQTLEGKSISRIIQKKVTTFGEDG